MMEPILNQETLSKSFESSDRIMEHHSKNFYQAFSLLPEERFKGVTALYAFNRYIDDLVDNDLEHRNKDDILIRLSQLEQALQSLYSEQKNTSEYLEDFRSLVWWPSFEITLVEFQIPLSPLLKQIHGQRMDMENFEVDTVEDLINYSSNVAGSVGMMMLPLLIEDDKNITNPSLIEACLHLGIGMQLTNILRDVGEDYRERRRIYLPNELMAKYNISVATIRELSLCKNDHKAVVEKIPSDFVLLWRELNELADFYYRSIFDYINYFHPKAQFPLVAASFTYAGISKAVRSANYNCFTRRNYTSKIERAKLIAEAKTFVNRSKKVN